MLLDPYLEPWHRAVISAARSMSFDESSSSDGSSSGSSLSVDETLVYEVRCALQLAVGRICRHEDDDAAEEERGCRRVEFSNEAIKALTDLTYHFATASLANDVVAFSKHARRQTVKTDDVLLVCRKNKHATKELKAIVAENPDLYETKPRSNTSKRGNVSKKRPPKSSSMKAKSKANKHHSQMQSSSSSSESSGDELLNGKLSKQGARRHKRASSFGSSHDSSDSELFPTHQSKSKKSQIPKGKSKTNQASTGLSDSESEDMGDSMSSTMVVDLCDD